MPVGSTSSVDRPGWDGGQQWFRAAWPHPCVSPGSHAHQTRFAQRRVPAQDGRLGAPAAPEPETPQLVSLWTQVLVSAAPSCPHPSVKALGWWASTHLPPAPRAPAGREVAQSGVDRVAWAQAPLWAPATQAQQALHHPHLLGAGEGGGSPGWAAIILPRRPPATVPLTRVPVAGRACPLSSCFHCGQRSYAIFIFATLLLGGQGRFWTLGQGVVRAFAEARLSPPQRHSTLSKQR